MLKKISYEEGQDLQEWANKNQPGKRSSGGFWQQIIFVRDDLPDIFYVPAEGSNPFEDHNPYSARVVGTHTSSKILLPVYSIKADSLEVRMRNNFAHWHVSIRSENPVLGPFYNLIRNDAVIHPVYFGGFTDDWVFGSYNQNPREFSVRIRLWNKLYAFLLIVAGGLGMREARELRN